MQNRRLAGTALLLIVPCALANCGGGSGGLGVVPESGAPDGTMQDASADAGDAVSDNATLGPDADAFSEAVVDASVPDVADSGDSGDTTIGSQDGEADGATDAPSDSTGGAMNDAADAAPVRLSCGSQMCSAGEFCGTPPLSAGDAGDGGDATASDGPLEAAADANAPDTDGSPEAAADAGSPEPDGSPEAAADASAPDTDGSPEAAPDGGAVRCETVSFANLCHNPNATVFFDQYDSDNQAALMMASALQNACQVSIIRPGRDDAGTVADPNVLDPITGQPKTGIGNLCLIGGGSFGQRAVSYIDNHSLSNVVVGAGTTDAGVFAVYFTDRTDPSAPKTIAIEAPYSVTNNTHDYFLLQLTVDPANGTVCLAAMGLTAQGTIAAGYYAAKHLIENGAYATIANSWRLYEWTDEDDGGVPDDNDTYALVASGP